MTAVEWLEQEISTKLGTNNLLDDLYKQAKAMEKGQIKDAHRTGFDQSVNWDDFNSEQYYNETYGKL